MCLKEGRVVVAVVADHVEQHHGDAMKFWYGKLQSLCERCHYSTKQQVEKSGFDKRIGPDGYPVDERHPFNKAK